MAACAIPQVVQTTGQAHLAIIVNTSSETVYDDTLLAKPVQIGLSGVNGVDHVLEIDGLFDLAVHGVGCRRSDRNVGGIGIVADHAHLGIIRAVVAMQAQNGVALLAVVDIHDRTPGFGTAVGDGKGLGHAGYRNPVRVSAVTIKIGGRMPFDGRHSAAHSRARQGYGRGDGIGTIAVVSGHTGGQRIDGNRFSRRTAASGIGVIRGLPADQDGQPAYAATGRKGRIGEDVIGGIGIGPDRSLRR